MTDYTYLHDLVFKFSGTGIKTVTKTGATLVGHASFIAPEAWLNHMFKPLTLEELSILEEKLHRPIPEVYKDFLTNFSNGLNILNGHLSLHGLRYNYTRDLDNSQPFDLVIDNNYSSEKPTNATQEMFFFGSYLHGGARLYFDKDETICFCSKDDAFALKKWDNFEDMLISEIIRIYGLFDDFGHPLKETHDLLGFISVNSEPNV